MRKPSRFIAFLMAMVMIFTLLPAAAFAASDPFTMRISSETAAPGNEVQVKLSLENNPGIASMNVKVSFGSELTLKDKVGENDEGVTFNPALPGNKPISPQKRTSPVTLSWVSGTEGNFNGDWFATLTFIVNKDALSVGENEKTIPITVSYDPDNIFNENEQNVPMTVVDGQVRITNYLAGDINGDGSVNQKDLTRLYQYYADWDVWVNKPVMDVNGDGKENQKDLTRLAQYFADWDVIINALPGYWPDDDCEHSSLTLMPAKAATCISEGNIAYYKCDDCGKLFKDAAASTPIALNETVTAKDPNNHPEDKIQIIPAVEPTATKEGSTEGSKCTACGVYITEPQPIPVPDNEYAIIYNIAGSDTYLASLGINNPNPKTYNGKKDIILKNITVTVSEERGEFVETEGELKYETKQVDVEKNLIDVGYDFKGWKDSFGNKVDIIERGTDKNIVLYADIAPHEYSIQFDTNSLLTSPIDDSTYTTDKAKRLPTLKTASYTFVGWTDQNGVFYEGDVIPKGTVGDLILTSNWVSMRNRPVTYNQPQALSVIEMEEEGILLFPFKIGYIENIPLYQIMDFGNSSPIEVTQEESYTYSIDETQAQEISKTVSNTTSNKRSYTLSSDWNQSTNVSKTQREGLTEEDYNAYIYESSKYSNLSLSNSNGHETVILCNRFVPAYIYESSKYSNLSLSNSNGHETVTKDNLDWSINASIGTSESKNTFSAGNLLTKALGIEAKIEGGVSGGSETTDKATWNHESSYEKGSSQSSKSETSNKLIKEIQEETGLCEGWEIGGNETEENVSEKQVSNENEYSTTTGVKITTEKKETKTFTDKRAADDNSYYRLVVSGKAFVFAVVMYDISEKTYSIYTYNVLDNNTSEYFDRSTTSAYNDYESIGKLSFSVPYSVHEYVSEKIAGSDGFVVNKETGIIDRYNGVSKDVVIPDYLSVPDGNNSYVAVKVKGISSNAFSNNKLITSVTFNDNITEIPEGAFCGCTSLENVNIESITKIEKNAFKDCTSLKALTISEKVTSLGDSAFSGAKSITVKASSADIALAAARSGAKSISVDFSKMDATGMSGKTITVSNTTEYFEFSGGKKTFTGLTIDSNASVTTEIKNATFTENTKTPLEISSPNVTLNSITVNSSCPALILDAESIVLKVNGNVALNTLGENVALIRNAVVGKYQALVSANFAANGSIITCGIVDDDNIVNFTNDKFGLIQVTGEAFNKLLTSCTVTFNPSGGSLGQQADTKSVAYGEKLGTLPTPSLDYHDFLGWFDKAEGGNKITSDSIVSGDMTLYAHWKATEYNVTFDVNGGDALSVSGKKVVRAGTYGELPTPTRTGYTFTGWYLPDPSGRDTKVTADTVVTTAKDHTLVAHWSVNNYTYTILYKSSNGTNLGSSSATYAYGTTNTIYPPAKSGYNTPSAQSVKWDSTSGKTITFTYSVASVDWTYKSGRFSSAPVVDYNARIEYRNRTASSVEVRVVWTSTIKAYNYTVYGQQFYMSSGNGSNTTTLCSAGTWKNSVNYDRSADGASGWVTVPLSTTNRCDVGVYIYYYQTNYNGTDMTSNYGSYGLSTTWYATVPAY